jgi:ABC-type glycerol-3-phosphate transport system substrate-binding protein
VKKCRFVLVILALLLVFGSVVTTAVELRVWMVGVNNERVKIINEILDADFTPRTGISAQIDPLPWAESDRRMQLAAASGDAPDIALMSGLLAAELGVRGAMVDFKQEFGAELNEHIKDSFPNAFRTYEFMGAVFGVPFQMAVSPMVYRQDILQELGMNPPTTWDDIRAMIPKLQAKEMNFALAYGIEAESFRDFQMFLWQHGGDMYTEDRTKSAWDTPQSLKAFKEYTGLYNDYKIPQSPQHFEAFRRGELPVACIPWWTYANYTIGIPELAGKWTLTVVPGTQRDGKIYHTNWAAGTPFAMFKSSKHKKEAWELIKFMTGADFQKKYTQLVMERIPGTIHLPSARSAYASMPIPEEHRKVLLQQADYSMTPPFAIASEMIVNRYIEFAINKVVVQKLDAEDALMEAAKQMNGDLKTKIAEYNRFIKKYQ